MKQTSAKCAAAQQGLTGRGKGFPLGVPYGMACGQALQPCGLTGGLTTSSRLRRTRTPIWMKELKKRRRDSRQNGLQFVRTPPRIHPARLPLIVRGKLFRQTEPLLPTPLTQHKQPTLQPFPCTRDRCGVWRHSGVLGRIGGVPALHRLSTSIDIPTIRGKEVS